MTFIYRSFCFSKDALQPSADIGSLPISGSHLMLFSSVAKDTPREKMSHVMSRHPPRPYDIDAVCPPARTSRPNTPSASSG
jgi:hypothetical protein